MKPLSSINSIDGQGQLSTVDSNCIVCYVEVKPFEKTEIYFIPKAIR